MVKEPLQSRLARALAHWLVATFCLPSLREDDATQTGERSATHPLRRKLWQQIARQVKQEASHE